MQFTRYDEFMIPELVIVGVAYFRSLASDSQWSCSNDCLVRTMKILDSKYRVRRRAVWISWYSIVLQQHYGLLLTYERNTTTLLDHLF